MAKNDKSRSAGNMRSGSQQERGQAAGRLGQSGGQARSGSQVGSQSGGRRKEMNISEAASILGRDDSSEEQKREAARILGREGGRSRGNTNR